MNPSVSVVVPAFNAEQFLAAALDSVLAQSFADFEVVVVDDGSTDGTRAVASRYGSRIRLLLQSNAGASAARNHAVREARAPVIAFLDSDDLWHRDHLETLVGLLRQDPDAVGAASGVEILTSDGRPVGQQWVFGSDGGDLLNSAWKGCPLLTSAVAVRRDVLVQVGGFDDALSTCNDWDLWLRLLTQGRFALAGRVTAGYRRRGGALSTDREARTRNRRRIVAKHAGTPWAHILAAYVELHHARHALAMGRRKDADESLKQAGTLYPGVTADLQWWAFFESFRPHDRPLGYSRRRLWRTVAELVRISSSRALPFRAGQRRQALASGFEAAGQFARTARLGPESRLFPVLARLARTRRPRVSPGPAGAPQRN